jgi:two-component system osmolarity sensor histidine kinase EnvZ
MGRLTFQFKRFLPKTLLGRSLLIIVTPLILLQVIATWVFFERHWDTVSTRLARALAGDVSAVIALMRETPTVDGRAAAFAFARRHMNLEIAYRDSEILRNTAPPTRPSRLERILRAEITAHLRRPLAIDADSRDREVLIDIQLPNGVLHVIAPRKRLFTSTTYLFVVLMVGSSMILFAVAMLFMRNQVRPIRRLAAAADSLGKGRDVPLFRLQGAAEVRQAAAAFNLMRSRLQRQVVQRTEMLAGVSHDLRTPLTRMKLQLEMSGESPGTKELKGDVLEMEKMVEGYLAFARGEGEERISQTNLRDVIEDVVAGARRGGGDVSFDAEGLLTLPIRKEAIRRCIANLVSNARLHGTRVAVHAQREANRVEITIDDDGPGIPEEERENVFRPFHRLDASRNVETGGVGLGLTIARDVVHNHGGEIRLEASSLGGLRAVIHLPV